MLQASYLSDLGFFECFVIPPADCLRSGVHFTFTFDFFVLHTADVTANTGIFRLQSAMERERPERATIRKRQMEKENGCNTSEGGEVVAEKKRNVGKTKAAEMPAVKCGESAGAAAGDAQLRGAEEIEGSTAGTRPEVMAAATAVNAATKERRGEELQWRKPGAVESLRR